ncbi:TPA: TIGR04141 family sporadically distributed protein [Bacillus toyonensis]|nr:TIGR04141 family sporadically distributed protein [Bacillus toyonensis]HDR7512697.1 TIGR04141 family sporadically distributed protein [Bacillus toyonensis]
MSKIAKNKNLIIYLLKTNEKNFKTFLKEKYKRKVTRHYINKQNLPEDIDKGIIFIYEEKLPLPEWVEYLNTFSEKKILDVSPKQISKAILFLTLKGNPRKTFAITFGNGSSLLDADYIVPDFGLKISKSLLSMNEIISIDTTSIDKKIFNVKKQSAAFLIPEKLLEYGTQNIVKNVHGTYEKSNERFSLGGNESLNFRGNIDLINDLTDWLNKFATIYSQDQNNLGISDDLIMVKKQEREVLDNKLGEKILNIINSNPITKRETSKLKITPNVTFELKNFNGFFISGLGYKNSKVSSDFFIDEVDFFKRLKRQLKPNNKNIDDILSKIKTDKLYKKIIDSAELEPICSIYKAINYEITYQSKKYILISGTWYEIDKEFYSVLQKEIDAIETPKITNNIQFIDFDIKIHNKIVSGSSKPQGSEGKYNEDLATQNSALMLDRQDYRVESEKMKQYGFKPQSSIEICDVMYFNKDKIQFIHVKRHSNASGTSHLLTQALVSAYAFLNDNNAVIDHINKVIGEFNNSNQSYNILDLKYENQKKEIVLAIIDKKANIKNTNSKMLSLLEMISLRENVKQLEHLGFKCYLKFIPTN